ncbi:hypothetical protein Mapa_012739 [Marchantia paleacea]|nr:hypothetical protein Mapa_012739 [Marchantia paleacea]
MQCQHIHREGITFHHCCGGIWSAASESVNCPAPLMLASQDKPLRFRACHGLEGCCTRVKPECPTISKCVQPQPDVSYKGRW